MKDSRATLIVLLVCAALWGVIILRNSAETLGNEIYEPTVTQAQVEVYAHQQLAVLQEPSFTEGVEYCGLIAENAQGELVSRVLAPGDHESCDIQYFDVRTLYPLATFHTHAAFNPDYDSEVPSTIDIESDVASGLDGYVSTPGGRLWHINGASGTARLACGESCLPQDPRYDPCSAPPPEATYNVASLRERDHLPWSGCYPELRAAPITN